MRTIKFRAWSEHDKTMYYAENGYEFVFNGVNIGYYPNQHQDELRFYNTEDLDEADKIEVMQFTGLLDKKSKECYEGDIIKWQYLSYKEPCITVVEYIDAEGAFSITPDDRGEREPFEIIGNIYQNPELLTND